LSVIVFSTKQTKTATKFKGLEKREKYIEEFEQILMVTFFNCAQSVYFHQFFCLL